MGVEAEGALCICVCGPGIQGVSGFRCVPRRSLDVMTQPFVRPRLRVPRRLRKVVADVLLDPPVWHDVALRVPVLRLTKTSMKAGP